MINSEILHSNSDIISAAPCLSCPLQCRTSLALLPPRRRAALCLVDPCLNAARLLRRSATQVAPKAFSPAQAGAQLGKPRTGALPPRRHRNRAPAFAGERLREMPVRSAPRPCSAKPRRQCKVRVNFGLLTDSVHPPFTHLTTDVNVTITGVVEEGFG